jgi:hypothetical protein
VANRVDVDRRSRRVDRERRSLNEHRHRLFSGRGGPIGYLCECADPACLTTVRLTEQEYAAVRPALVLAPGHVDGSRATTPDPPSVTFGTVPDQTAPPA